MDGFSVSGIKELKSSIIDCIYATVTINGKKVSVVHNKSNNQTIIQKGWKVTDDESDYILSHVPDILRNIKATSTVHKK